MRPLLAALALPLLLLTACDDQEPRLPQSQGAADSGGSGGSGQAGSGGAGQLPRLSELKVGTLNRLEPGGETVCSRGTPFALALW